ncbi:MAG: hypothetical protein DMG91_18075 [Acidobacteria bacterium]|nr:MAG: hypothetical protein DMG91_18075 [Acidobacteriota bacterium]
MHNAGPHREPDKTQVCERVTTRDQTSAGYRQSFSQGAHQPSAKLEFEAIIARSTKPTSPPTVWYGLTLVGQELCAALVNVIDVAQRLKRKEVTTAGTR